MKGHHVAIQIAKVQVFDMCPTDTRMGFASQRILLSENFRFVKVQHFVKIVCLIHDCLSGGCRTKECLQTVRVEQEHREVKKKVWYHCPMNKYYYLNKFRFSGDVKL